MEITVLASALLLLSMALNVYLLFKISKKAKERAPNYDATALLHELTAGPALIKVEYVDPTRYMLRSPRT